MADKAELSGTAVWSCGHGVLPGTATRATHRLRTLRTWTR